MTLESRDVRWPRVLLGVLCMATCFVLAWLVTAALTRGTVETTELQEGPRRRPLLDVVRRADGDLVALRGAPYQFEPFTLADGTPIFVGANVREVALAAVDTKGQRLRWCPSGGLFLDEEGIPAYDSHGLPFAAGSALPTFPLRLIQRGPTDRGERLFRIEEAPVANPEAGRAGIALDDGCPADAPTTGH